MLTAIDILIQYDDNLNFVDDGPSNRLNHERKIDKWQDKVDDILYGSKELHIV